CGRRRGREVGGDRGRHRLSEGGRRLVLSLLLPPPKKATPNAAVVASGNCKYWLLKTESGEWSWSDPTEQIIQIAPWDSVCNRQAINSLYALRRGDRCLFYHSSAGATSRHIVGVMEVAREWYEGEGEAASGGAVDVRAVGEFRLLVALGEIR
ncbi:Os08g0485300, partial [Oryza sativa Japonica Group]